MSALTSPRPAVVLWLRSDLRTHDNPALVAAAAKAASTGMPLIPAFTFDTRTFGDNARTTYGTAKTGPRRAQFVSDAVSDVRARLQRMGSDCVITHGRPEEILPALASGGEIFATTETASEESRLTSRVRSSCPVTEVWGSTMYSPDDLPYRISEIPHVFTVFRQKVERDSVARAPLATPRELPLFPTDVAERLSGVGCEPLASCPPLRDLGYAADLPPADKRGGQIDFVGGETAGLARVQHYLWGSDSLATYFDTRNAMLGADGSSKLSPWLAHGCVSPRFIREECERYERERTKNKSTYWLVFELLWRDYFRFLAMHAGDDVYHIHGLLRGSGKDYLRNMTWSRDAEKFRAWREGRTGVPLVDANMRELLATGYMSNRGRQNVASFLTLEMQIDWRLGAAHFEEHLLDYDVASNWGNWMAAAGMTGGRVNRFNMVKQSRDYDPQGTYLRLWCPELERVPAPQIFQPHAMSRGDKQKYGVAELPQPILTAAFTRPSFQQRDEPTRVRPGGQGDSGGGRDGRGGGGGGKRRKGGNRGRGKLGTPDGLMG